MVLIGIGLWINIDRPWLPPAGLVPLPHNLVRSFGVERSAWSQGIPPAVKSDHRSDWAQAADLEPGDNSADIISKHCS